MRYRHVVLAIGALCSSHGLQARGVQVQNFLQGGAQVKPFVLVAAASDASEPEAELAIHSEALDGLAREWAELGGNATPTESQAAIAVPDIRWAAGARASRRRGGIAPYDPAGYALSESSDPFCRGHPYQPNPALRAAVEHRRLAWYGAMVDAACEAGVPVSLFDEVIVQESGYNPLALSPKGAASLAQLMPDRARRLGVANIWDPAENMRGGARYLRALLDEFGRYDLALAAYNAGENRVRATLQVPRITETIRYVANILMATRDQIARTSGNGD